jgi:transposase
MSEVTIIGVDLAKRVFQLHGSHQDGSIAGCVSNVVETL